MGTWSRRDFLVRSAAGVSAAAASPLFALGADPAKPADMAIARWTGPKELAASDAILAIGIFNVPVFARLTRGAALSLWRGFTRNGRRIVFLSIAGAAALSALLILAVMAPLVMVLLLQRNRVKNDPFISEDS